MVPRQEQIIADIAIDGQSPIPLYLQLRDGLKRQIESGRAKVGERLPTVREISRACGLSFFTVTRAFADLAREGLIVTRRGSGAYVAEPAAGSVEVLIPGHRPRSPTLSDFQEQMFEGLRELLLEPTWRLWISHLDGKVPDARELVTVSRARRSLGLVAYRPHTEVMPVLRLVAEQVPVVTLFRTLPASRADSVVADPAEALRTLLVRHIQGGARAFASVWYSVQDDVTSDELSPYSALQRAFTETLAQAGIAPVADCRVGAEAVDRTGSEATAHLAAEAGRALPDGCVVLAQTAHLAESLVQANPCLDVITYTESRATRERFRPVMSLLYVGIETLAREAARLLLERKHRSGPRDARIVRVPAEIVERNQRAVAARQSGHCVP